MKTIEQVYIFLVIFGFGYGGAIPIYIAMRGEYFGRKHFGTIQGLFLSVSTISTMIGPPFAGWICDVTGSYRLAFIILAAVPAIGILLFLMTPPPQNRPADTP